jgi:hypothetical protein
MYHTRRGNGHTTPARHPWLTTRAEDTRQLTCHLSLSGGRREPGVAAAAAGAARGRPHAQEPARQGAIDGQGGRLSLFLSLARPPLSIPPSLSPSLSFSLSLSLSLSISLVPVCRLRTTSCTRACTSRGCSQSRWARLFLSALFLSLFRSDLAK